MSSVPAALLERDFKFKQLTQREVLANVVGGVAGVVVAFNGGGVWSLVVQTLTTAGVGVLVLWSVSGWRPGFDIHWQNARDLRHVGLGLLGVQLFGFVNSQSDKLLIGIFVDPTAVGYYFIGTRIISIVLDVQTSVISTISMTTLSKVQHDPVAFRRIFYKFISTSGSIAVFSFAALAALAPILIPAVFGHQWRSSVPITQILCLLGALNSVVVFDREALVAMGRSRLALSITAVQTVVGVFAVLATVAFGPIGVAIGVTARQYIVWPFRLRQLAVALHIDIKTYLGKVFAPMGAGFVTAGVMYLVVLAFPDPQELWSQLAVCSVASVVGLVVYATLGRWLFRDVLIDINRELRKLGKSKKIGRHAR